MSTPHVTVTVSLDSVGLPRVGFGKGLFLSHNATFSGAELVREYSGYAEVVADGFPATSPEALAALVWFSQSPHPAKFKIGKAPTKPTQVYTIVPIAIHSHTYRITVKGQGVTATDVTYTSDSATTVAEVCAGLLAALNAVVGKNFTATGGVTEVTITGNAAGNWFSLAPVDFADWTDFGQTHADPGLATDLAAIIAKDPDWYILMTAYNSNAYVTGASAVIEATPRQYWVDVNETDAVNTAAGNSDTLDDLLGLARNRTHYGWHPEPAQFMMVAWASIFSAYEPGKVNPKWRSPSGVVAPTLTTTQRANLVNRKANFLEVQYGRTVTVDGQIPGSYKYIDITRNIDWMVDEIQASQTETMAGVPLIGMDDPGISTCAGALRGSGALGVRQGVLAADPAPVVTAPKAAEISAAKKAARTIPSMKLSGTFKGAVNNTEIGVSLTF